VTTPKVIQFCWCPPMENDRDPGQHQGGCIYREWLHIWNRTEDHVSPFRGRLAFGAPVLPACYAASWGWVHVRPGCRCPR